MNDDHPFDEYFASIADQLDVSHLFAELLPKITATLTPLTDQLDVSQRFADQLDVSHLFTELADPDGQLNAALRNINAQHQDVWDELNASMAQTLDVSGLLEQFRPSFDLMVEAAGEVELDDEIIAEFEGVIEAGVGSSATWWSNLIPEDRHKFAYAYGIAMLVLIPTLGHVLALGLIQKIALAFAAHYLRGIIKGQNEDNN